MPLDKYYGGNGEKVMKNMKKEYGDKKGEQVFYATNNKRKSKLNTGPSDKMKKKHKIH